MRHPIHTSCVMLAMALLSNAPRDAAAQNSELVIHGCRPFVQLISVLRRSLDAVYHHDLYRPAPRYKSQPHLLL